MNQSSFSAWFSRQLKRREWSQADYSRRTGTATSVVSYWATGKRVPDPDSCQAIADVFGMDVDEVLTRAGHRPQVEPLHPDDPRLELVALMKRIRLTEDREDGLRALLRGWLERDQESRG